MKSTGIVRKLDDLGRVVVPMELRRTLNIKEGDAMEVFVDNNKIILKKYEPHMTCQITGNVSESNVLFADGKIRLSYEGAKILEAELKEFLG